MSQEFNMSWNELTQLNIVSFMYRLRFLEHILKQRNKKK